jgi:CRP-like cAMP-binding protein
MLTNAASPNAAGLFELLGADERRMLLEKGDAIDLKAEECLFQAGAAGGTLYVVNSGAVEIFLKDNAGQKIPLKRAEIGDFFGEVSLWTHPRPIINLK